MNRYKTLSNPTRGNFYILAAPSGAGKTSLVKALAKSMDNFKISISHTTRPPRPGEQDGVDYHFIDDAQFKQMVAEKKFLEHAEVFGCCYGTSHEWVLQQLDKGIDILLEIDWQGARQIRQEFPAAVSIFVLPPSMSVLRERLEQRNQDNSAIITQRMAQAQTEMMHYHEFDYLVINDDFDVAFDDVRSIVQSKRLKCAVQAAVHQKLLAELIEK